jgi:hypothetical protein
LIGFALDKRVKREIQVQIAAVKPTFDNRLIRALLASLAWFAIDWLPAAANLQLNLDRALGAKMIQCILYTTQMMLPDPIQYKPVGREQPQRITVLHGMQWSDPSVELLLGKLMLKTVQARFP